MRLFRRQPKMPTLREDYKTFTLRGDNAWGNAITWTNAPPPDHEHEATVHGWLPIHPRVGDRLLVKMQSGKMGVYVFTEVVPCDNPKDMFFAKVAGAIAYAEAAEASALAVDEPSILR